MALTKAYIKMAESSLYQRKEWLKDKQDERSEKKKEQENKEKRRR